MWLKKKYWNDTFFLKLLWGIRNGGPNIITIAFRDKISKYLSKKKRHSTRQMWRLLEEYSKVIVNSYISQPKRIKRIWTLSILLRWTYSKMCLRCFTLYLLWCIRLGDSSYGQGLPNLEGHVLYNHTLCRKIEVQYVIVWMYHWILLDPAIIAARGGKQHQL